MNGPVVIAHSTITCPKCGYAKTELMPTDSCQYYYDCENCSALLKAMAGDCCVFCSYADVPCPPIQQATENGQSSSCCN